VRVPRAWGSGGETLAAAAWLELPYPEAVVVDADTLDEQTAALAEALPATPLVVGGCCCAHLGAIRGLARRHGRLAVVWLDAHGDLNTPETSPSGDLWGMPLRMAIDSGDVRAEDVALIGARTLDPGELAFLQRTAVSEDVAQALAGARAVYVAFDVDVLDPGAAASFMSEPVGLSVAQAEETLQAVRGDPVSLVGLGFTGHLPQTDPAVLLRLAAAVGL
jgi:arginase